MPLAEEVFLLNKLKNEGSVFVLKELVEKKVLKIESASVYLKFEERILGELNP